MEGKNRKKFSKTIQVTKKNVFLRRLSETPNMAVVAQLVRVPDCGSVGRRFESDLPPERLKNSDLQAQIAVFFVPIGTETGQNDTDIARKFYR